MTKYILAAATLCAAATVSGQTTAPRSFEVASVKVAAPCCAPGQWRESKAIDDRIDFRYVTLKYCVAFAYRLKEYQVSGPPALTEGRWDIVAKGPAGTRREQLPEMVQALLAERFKLEAHRDKKEFNVYALVLGKGGLKLKECPPRQPGDPEGAAFGISMAGNGTGKIEARHADMTALANTLPRMVGRPVVDLTGLTARYDFDLEFSPEDVNAMALPSPTGAMPPTTEFSVSIFTSVQRVGLRLEPQKLPLDVVVVDRTEKTPIEN